MELVSEVDQVRIEHVGFTVVADFRDLPFFIKFLHLGTFYPEFSWEAEELTDFVCPSSNDLRQPIV